METSYEDMVKKLMDNGIPEAVATSMVNSMIKTENKPSKRRSFEGKSGREKVEAPIIHEDKCMTCGCITTQKVMTRVYVDEIDEVVKGVRGVCHNCPKYLDTLSKEALISLFLIQNHSDPDIRMLSAAHQIKLAQLKKPAEWIGYKINRPDMTKPDRKEK